MELGFTFHFQVRIANNLYSLARSSLFEYETHFTVMVCLEYHFIQQQEDFQMKT